MTLRYAVAVVAAAIIGFGLVGVGLVVIGWCLRAAEHARRAWRAKRRHDAAQERLRRETDMPD